MKVMIFVQLYNLVLSDLIGFNRLGNNIFSFTKNRNNGLQASPYTLIGKNTNLSKLNQLLRHGTLRISKRRRFRKNFYKSTMEKSKN